MDTLPRNTAGKLLKRELQETIQLVGNNNAVCYNSIGPNPKVVRMFIAERGISGIPTQTVDLHGGENRQAPYLAKNPTGGLPALELDDGSYLTEITAICEYLDEDHPGGTSLIGTDAAGTRRNPHVDTADRPRDCRAAAAGFPLRRRAEDVLPRMRCIPQAADDLKTMAREKLAWLDGQIAGRPFICGDRLTLADIFLFPFLQFAATVRQPLDPANTNLTAWYDRMAARPSAGV